MGKTQQLGTLVNGFAVDANGNVGIGGAANASYKLAVTGASLFSGAGTFSGSVTANSTISAYYGNITSGNTPATSGTTPVNPMLNLTNNRGVGMYFGGKYSGDYAQWIQVSDVGNLSVNYPLLLNPNGGNVGIGTSSPSRILSISQSNPYISLTSTTNSREFLIGNDSSGFVIYDATAATYRIALNASGNVGIGTTNPLFKLDVIGGIRVNEDGAGTKVIQIRSDFAGVDPAINVSTNNALLLQTNNTERMRITSGGNVGIGTSSPQSLLDVRGATPFIRITDTSVTGENGLIMDAGGGFIRGALTINYGTGEFKISAGSAGNSYYQTFLVNGTERMRITSGGALSLNGRFIHQGVSRLCYAGTVAGNGSFSVNLVVGSQSAVKITAAMNHYGYIDGYGCAKMAWVGSTPAFSQIVISEVTSGAGGSWSFTNGGSGIITITKNAGSYGGGGYYFIEVVGNDPQSIS